MNNLTLPVLDHGFVALRNLAGPNRRPDAVFDADDTDPAQAARMSFDQMDSERAREEDIRLCNYLMKNWHSSPFEMIECWLEMKLPIFVARQFVRHRTISLNEVSGRYVQLPAQWYIPDVVGGKPVGGAKQGQSDTLSELEQILFKKSLQVHCENGYALYETALKRGVAAEHARMHLSLNHYTHWLWKQDFHNILHFLQLRDHIHAQLEAQLYAQQVDKLLRQFLPDLMALYDKYRKERGLILIAYLLRGPAEESELSFTPLLPADKAAGWKETKLYSEA